MLVVAAGIVQCDRSAHRQAGFQQAGMPRARMRVRVRGEVRYCFR